MNEIDKWNYITSYNTLWVTCQVVPVVLACITALYARTIFTLSKALGWVNLSLLMNFLLFIMLSLIGMFFEAVLTTSFFKVLYAINYLTAGASALCVVFLAATLWTLFSKLAELERNYGEAINLIEEKVDIPTDVLNQFKQTHDELKEVLIS